ncbi:MAG TPA: cupredoxin family copper-binding protein [Candidatus Rubrimentiphilum sp.]|nr:cupredoxin family copper-binding protein [Candidatus Rubrimentiphilum sp.]
MKELMLSVAAAVSLVSVAAVSPAMPAAHTVQIKGFAFAPKSLTINAGETVKFVNDDSEAHTVVADKGAFSSGGLDTNDSWSVRLQKPGTYTYFCSLHPYMKGTIVVQAMHGAMRGDN